MKLNYKRTILVGFAFFLISAFWQAYDTIKPKILTNRFGLSQSVSGFVMALDNILSLFLLPFFGALADKCNSRRGRRTPFIIVGTLLAALSFSVLAFVDNAQLNSLSAIAGNDRTVYEALYDADLNITTPSGEKIEICEKFTRDEFVSMAEESTENTDYTEYVLPAKNAYAREQTSMAKGIFILFVTVLFLVLVSMATFRSPAVALMPDITMKPLRSKGNAIINLMGAVGGIIVLIMGMVFKTGSPANSYMSYVPFFISVSALMLISLVIFIKKVDEPRFVKDMQADSKAYGIDNSEDGTSGDKKLSKGEFRSLILILLSVVFWYMGYNAVTSKYSVYAGSVLGLDYNLTLMIATGSAILTYLPVGIIASKIGRKKTILAGVLILASAFGAASFMRAGSSPIVLNILFTLAGIGWATINVNSFPMVVELATGGNVGKYTGFYYTASMAAQTVTPVLSGLFLDIKMTYLFPYATIFVLLSFVTMSLTKHGDSKPMPSKSVLESFDIDD